MSVGEEGEAVGKERKGKKGTKEGEREEKRKKRHHKHEPMMEKMMEVDECKEPLPPPLLRFDDVPGMEGLGGDYQSHL